MSLFATISAHPFELRNVSLLVNACRLEIPAPSLRTGFSCLRQPSVPPLLDPPRLRETNLSLGGRLELRFGPHHPPPHLLCALLAPSRSFLSKKFAALFPYD